MGSRIDSPLILLKNVDPILVQYIKQVLQIADLAIWRHCVYPKLRNWISKKIRQLDRPT